MKKEKHIQKDNLKNGYRLRVIIKVNGKPICFGSFNRSDYATDKLCLEAAKMCRDQALIDIKNNHVVSTHNMTVQEAYDSAMELLVNNTTTRAKYTSIYNSFFPAGILAKPIRDLTAADLQKMLNKYALDHSQDSVKRAVTMLNKMYKAVMMNGMPIADMSQMINMPVSKHLSVKRDKFCTEEELEIFLEALLDYNAQNAAARKRNRDIYLIFRIMQYLGLRPQEALALCSEDIDLQNGLLFIRHSIGTTGDKTRQLITTKTEDSVRTLPIPAETYGYLAEAKTHQTTPLFVNPKDGLPYDVSYIDTVVSSVTRKNGVPHVTMYMMRHNFATDMVKQDVKLTQSLMGHESAAMTLKYADTASVDEMKEALKKRYN